MRFEHCLLLLECDGCRHTVVFYPTVCHLLFYSLPSSAWKKHGGGVDLIKQLIADSLIKYNLEVFCNTTVTINQSMAD